MNKLVIKILTSIIFSYTLNAYYILNAQDIRMYDIYTPNDSPVTTWLMVEQNLGTRQAFDALFALNYPNAIQIKTYDNCSSTRKFNCHGHAWLKTEGGPDRWIGYSVTTEEDIYMSDGSYTQVPAETYPGKVSWGSGDHSAVTTAQSGVFISKWNEWPLMQHASNYSPFGSSNLKYFLRCMIHRLTDNRRQVEAISYMHDFFLEEMKAFHPCSPLPQWEMPALCQYFNLCMHRLTRDRKVQISRLQLIPILCQIC